MKLPQTGLRQILVSLFSFLCLVFLACVFAQDTWDNPDGHLGALSMENLKQARPDAPFNITGTWLIDFSTWQFDPLPDLKPQYRKMHERARIAAQEGKVFSGDVGLCWPPGLPMMMNRVWPIHMIQLPTSIVMITNFENQVRWIFMDGREHTDPELYVPSYNGESIGHWEAKALVIDTQNFTSKRHWVREGIPISEAFRSSERITLSEDGQTLTIEYTLTDPNIWSGEWKSTKVYRRKDKVDFVEVHCLPDLNEGIMSTNEEYQVNE